jgi:sugar/nucleoside kinase (ribokinase family)
VRDVCDRLSLNADEWCDREVVSPCFRARRVAGTTGAGDCTIAGFLAALLRGEGPVQAATSATAVGAASVEAPDATSGVPPWPELAARVRAGWERHPITLTRPDKEPA